MRGKGAFFARVHCPDGITPAYAGKSVIDTLVTLPSVGSPPPMRGKEFSGMVYNKYRGITPAYAGKRKKQKGS